MIAKIVLFEATGLSGNSVMFTSSGNLDKSFNDKVSSIVVVNGTWSLYKDGNFSGKRWEVRANGGPDGDGVYPSYRDWSGDNDAISSVVIERSRWMEENTEIHEKKLRNICLPASHDSGTYALTNTWTPALSEELALAMNTLNSIAESIESIPGIGPYIPNPAEWLIEAVTPTVRKLAKATGRSAAQQLRDGIRCLDFRVYYNASDKQYYIWHTLMGSNMKDVLQDVADFLAATAGEILYITFGHYQEFSDAQVADFLQFVKDRLGMYAYKVKTNGNIIVNNPFERTYDEILTQGNEPDSSGTGQRRHSVVILVNAKYSADKYKDDPPAASKGQVNPPAGTPDQVAPSSATPDQVAPPAVTQDKVFWPKDYSPPDIHSDWANLPLYGFYTNKSDKDEVMAGQEENLAMARERNLPFPLYMTLTPQDDECAMIVTYGAADAIEELGLVLMTTVVGLIVGGLLVALAESLKITESMLPYKSLEELSDHLNEDLYVIVKQRFVDESGPNEISMLYTDFAENTMDVSLVDLAIQLSNRS